MPISYRHSFFLTLDEFQPAISSVSITYLRIDSKTNAKYFLSIK